MLHSNLSEFQRNRDILKFTTYYLKNKKEIKELIEFSMQVKNGKLAEYVSWLCNHIAEKAPNLFQNLEKQIIRVLQKETNQSILRNWLRMFIIVPPTAEFDGEVLDICINFIENPNNKVALPAFAMKVMIPICTRNPELKSELFDLIDLHSEGKTAAYHSSENYFKKKSSN
jgi:hypothetical protein